MRRIIAGVCALAAIASGAAAIALASNAAAVPIVTTLTAGQQLTVNQSLHSADGRFSLNLQADGNLVLRAPTRAALWNTGTEGHSAAKLVMQGDGNVVLYTPSGSVLWTSKTYGRGGHKLVLQADGNLVLYTASGSALWNSHTVIPSGSTNNPRVLPPASVSVLKMGAGLVGGQSLFSPNHQYQAAMQTDGNFVVYGPHGAVWNSHTNGHAGARLSLQTDGNLVLRNAATAPLWYTSTSGHAPDWLTLQNDGALVLTPAVGSILWNSLDPQIGRVVSAAVLSGTWAIAGHGNGHGHGMSQYGAYGRASAGQSMAQIMAFYYPNTVLGAKSASLGATPVRVLLSDTGSYATVAATAGLNAAGVGVLATPGASEYRLVPSGAGLAVQALVGATWTTVHAGLPASVRLSPGSAGLQVVRNDNSRAAYRGTITGVRSGNSVLAVNTVGLDDYVRGVAPNESPSSWPTAALQSQVVAARTYARFEVVNEGGSGTYDICDTSSCQVYRGESSEAASTNAAVTATQGQIVTYAGAPIFAQFGSSNGGWTFAGGKPYLLAAPDSYDNASTDPWYNWTRSVKVASVAGYYGLTSISALRITGRNGHGDWGGAVTSAQIDGVRAGVATTISVTGTSLRSAMGLPLEWFTITN